MNVESRSSVEFEVKSILKRRAGHERRLVSELSELVLKAYEEGEDDGKKHERRRHRE